MKKVILFGTVLVFLAMLAAATVFWRNFLNTPASDSNENVVYEVIPGKSFSTVAKELENRDVITNAAIFSLFARLRGESSKMKVGEYMLHPNMRPSEILEVLLSGKSIGYNFTVTEGLNIYEIADLIGQTKIATREQFLKAVQNPAVVKTLIGEEHPSLEGYLFPDTYQYTKYTDLKTLLHSMVQKFLVAYAKVEPQAKTLGWSRHQVVTLASIVEKETGAPEERPLIASIFHNRLGKEMMLQTDPTVLYAKMLGTNAVELSITKNDLMMEHPYNTYRIKGLPPGPISNPGAEALKAAVNPANSEYLYFVSQNNGTSIFSKTYAEHQKAVLKYQVDPLGRVGKSWRDLKKAAGH